MILQWPGSAVPLLTGLSLLHKAGLAATGLARELLNRVQKLRKRAGLVATDPVEIFYRTSGGERDWLLHDMLWSS